MKAIIPGHARVGTCGTDHNGSSGPVRRRTKKPFGTKTEAHPQSPEVMMRIVTAAVCFLLVISLGFLVFMCNAITYAVYVDITPADAGASPGKLRLAEILVLKSKGSISLEEGLGMSVRELVKAIGEAADNTGRPDSKPGNKGQTNPNAGPGNNSGSNVQTNPNAGPGNNSGGSGQTNPNAGPGNNSGNKR